MKHLLFVSAISISVALAISFVLKDIAAGRLFDNWAQQHCDYIETVIGVGQADTVVYHCDDGSTYWRLKR